MSAEIDDMTPAELARTALASTNWSHFWLLVGYIYGRLRTGPEPWKRKLAQRLIGGGQTGPADRVRAIEALHDLERMVGG